MRKITILIATCVLFIMPSCTKSNEDKAEELISKCLKENMSYPDSYEAISTKVDSSFVKVSTIIEILDLSEDVFSDISKIRAIKSDISSAQTAKDTPLQGFMILPTVLENTNEPLRKFPPTQKN